MQHSASDPDSRISAIIMIVLPNARSACAFSPSDVHREPVVGCRRDIKLQVHTHSSDMVCDGVWALGVFMLLCMNRE